MRRELFGVMAAVATGFSAPLGLAQSAALPADVAKKGGIAMSVEDLKTAVIDKTIEAQTAAGRNVTLRWRSDNTAEFRGQSSSDGTWRFSETGYCTIWQSSRGGAEACFEVFRMPDGAYDIYEVVPGGSQYSGRWLSVR